MNLRRKELIVSVIIIVAFIFIGMNASVLASSLDYPWNNMPTNDNGTGELIEVVGNKDQEVTVNNTSTNSNTSANNTNTNKPGQIADTGLEDWPWLIIAICAVSTVFAYNKIREYNDN